MPQNSKVDRSDHPPNVILIISDCMGYRDIEPYGATDISTPSLDQLAEKGTKFSDFYAAAPVCGPSRAAFLTGLYPSAAGITDNITEGNGLSPEHRTLASYLKDAGYSTALFGKWHLGKQPEFNPNAHGFDEFLGFHDWTIGYYTHKAPNGDPGLYQDHLPIERDGYLTDILTDEASTFITKNTENPFFLYLAYSTALAPIQPPDLPKEKWNSGWDVYEATRHDYARMVEAMDSGIGRVLSTLEAQGLDENTLVIFAHDHGGGPLAHSHPFFHGFATLWEGGIRVPLIIRWPGRVPENHTSPRIAIAMDVTATILNAVGLEDRTSALDGVSLLPIHNDRQESEERCLFWCTNYHNWGGQKAVRKGQWKYLIDGVDEGTPFLFNLRDDMSERINLFSRYPEVVVELRTALETWESRYS